MVIGRVWQVILSLMLNLKTLQDRAKLALQAVGNSIQNIDFSELN